MDWTNPPSLNLSPHELRSRAAERVSRWKELAKDPLALFNPLPRQAEFLASKASTRLFRAGNQVGKAQPVDEPVLTPDGWKPIGELCIGDSVIGGDGLECSVTGVFPQGEKEVYEVVFDDGAATRCCAEHLWKVKVGKRNRFGKNRTADNWQVMSLAELMAIDGLQPRAMYRAVIPATVVDTPYREVPIDPYLLGIMLGDGTMRTTPMFSSADAEITESVGARIPAGCQVQYREQYDYAITRTAAHGRNPMTDLLRELGVWSKLSQEKFVPCEYLFNSVEVRLSLLRGLMDTDGSVAKPSKWCIGGAVEFCTTSPQLADDVAYLVRSLGGKCQIAWRETTYTHKGERRVGRPSARMRIRMQAFNPFSLERKASLYRKTTKSVPSRVMREMRRAGRAECVCISVDSSDHTYVTRDCIVTHNTATCALEVARIALGRHPTFTRKRPLLIYVIGYDLDHIGRRVYTALFKPGLFQIIKDLHTGRWRTYRPWDKDDQARETEAEDAPPLIPAEFIDPKGWAWDHKADRQFSVCRLFFGENHPMNGTEIRAYGSKSEPPQGDQVDLIWFDEDLADASWVSEMRMRLMKRKGRMIWSAMPHLRNDALVNLSHMADEQKHDPTPNVQEFVMSLLDNPYIDEEEKRKATEGLSHDEYRARVFGDFCADSVLVYPTFHKDLHCYPRPDKDPKDKLDELIDKCKGQLPYEWTRYLSVDPGHTVCAVLSAAIPPPELVGGTDFIVIEDELYLRRCDAETFGDAVQQLVTGRFYEAFVIDDHGSRVTQAGAGITIRRQYSDALEARGIRSRQTDAGFYRGIDSPEAGNELVRGWLAIRQNGTCKIRILKERCPNLIHEFPYYKKHIVLKDEVKDKPVAKKNHAMDALRYLAGMKPIYIPPDPPKRPDSAGYLAWKKLTTEFFKQGEYVNLGPAA